MVDSYPVILNLGNESIAHDVEYFLSSTLYRFSYHVIQINELRILLHYAHISCVPKSTFLTQIFGLPQMAMPASTSSHREMHPIWDKNLPTHGTERDIRLLI